MSGGRRRHQEDDVDRACNTWAYQYVRHYPNASGGQVGAPRCSIAELHRLHDGAGSSTERAEQAWPEVYLGEGLLVSIARQAMSERFRRMLHAHYVARWFDWSDEKREWVRKGRPTKQAYIAGRLGISLAHYHALRDATKACVGTVLSLDTKALARARGQE